MSARRSDSPRPPRTRATSPTADDRPVAPPPPSVGAARRTGPARSAATLAEPTPEPPRRRGRTGNGNGNGNGDGDDAGDGQENGKKNGGRTRGASGAAPRVRTVARAGESRRGARGNGGDGSAALAQLTLALRHLRNGDFSFRLGASDDPAFADAFSLFDETAEQRAELTSEILRVSRTVGREGQMGDRVALTGAAGDWIRTADALNGLIADVLQPTTEVARVLTAVAEGDLSQKMLLEMGGRSVQGEFLRIGTTVNRMVDQLNAFSGEVTRVAREVGTEGQLGGQAHVPGVAGTWKDLTDSVNAMAGSLTMQVRNIADVTKAVAAGDLSRKITVDVKGEMLELKTTINTMVEQLSGFAGEVTRVAREVGTEGVLGGQAHVPGVAGTWKDLTDNVNALASNLTGQVRDTALVITAVANGDLSQKMTADVRGEMLELKNTVNTMVDQLRVFAGEVTRVAKEVGTEGVLGGQARVPGVAGTWADLTENVNAMAGNLTGQVRNIADVTTAVARGDLSRKITVDVRGEMLELKNTINTMVDQLNAFASEVTRVAREVGTEGRLGGQANVPGVAGTWKDLTDNVNQLAGNLTVQLRDVSGVASAIQKGDLSRKITVDARGEVLQIKDVINTMVDQLNGFAAEVTRVAREVGSEGRLGGQANVPGVAGTWKDLTDQVNFLAGSLTAQVRNIAEVTTAVARGDLGRKITVDVQGEVLELKNTINTMVDQLSGFASEVTRVAREVGTEGVLGGQAQVEGVSGVWANLTQNVNAMASNLTNQVRNIAFVTTGVAAGDLSQKITVEAKGEFQELKTTMNTMVDRLRTFADEVTRVAREVGTEGRLGGQAQVQGVAGTWKDLTDNVNQLAGNLTVQLRDVSGVATAIARGDLTRKITVDVRGEILQIKDVINTMVDQLNGFAGEVTRVAREVGTEGRLGGQAKVPGAAGVWRDLTDNVNTMAGNLTSQVRNIKDVTVAVAAGDLSQKITVDVRGELLELKNTINTMVDQLSGFAAEVTRVAKEVGTEGKLGGQANVPGVAGTWKDLTDNVNVMATSLTTQVRAIADVATAVTRGDLSRQITAPAVGEVDALKQNINQMIANLKETTGRNEEQDWLKTNLARFSRLMQGQKNLDAVARLVMSELTPLVQARTGAFYVMEQAAEGHEVQLRLIASYAFKARKHIGNTWALGEGLVGQAALEKKSILLTGVPDDYIQITSGLGEAPPRNILVLPILFEGEVKAVVELASFLPFSDTQQTFLDQLQESIGVVLNMIQANARTEELLAQSQSLTGELQNQSEELRRQQDELRKSNSELEQQARTLKQSEELLRDQQEELQQVNEELEEKAALLAEQNKKVELKNSEVENARQALEEKASQLALSSKYKSEFLANMSHELRTPLNSLLILARLLADNKDGNLTEKQTEFARTILGSGSDLLTLINDVLDLSKVEAGKMEVVAGEVQVAEVRDFAERTFRPLAEQKGLQFAVEVQAGAPDALVTDGQRLNQVLKNLLANAIKFTSEGSVTLTVRRAEKGRQFANRVLDTAETVVAFAVSDTGVGVSKDKQQLIFEAFQQADGTTSRQYGGTGLGLSISREIARLLGGEIRVESTPGQGSTFTLFLPARYVDPEAGRARDEGDRGPGGNGGARRAARPPVRPQPRAARPASVLGTPAAAAAVGPAVSAAAATPDVTPAAGVASVPPRAGAQAPGVAPAVAPAPDDELDDAPDEALDWGTGGADDAAAEEERRAADIERRAPLTTELPNPAADDRDAIEEGDTVVLVIENDLTFAKVLLDMARSRDFKGLVALDGRVGVDLAHQYQPDAITLDLDMPGVDGFAVLERLKRHPDTRHIPVHIISGTERRHEGLSAGAIAYLEKPVSAEALDAAFGRIATFLDRRVRRLLVVEDDAAQRQAIEALIAHEDVEITAVDSADAALAALTQQPFDCVVLDLGLAGTSGFELLERVKGDPAWRDLPIIVYTGKSLTPEEETRLRRYAETIIIKDVKSPERLLDETALFLHRVEANLPDDKRRVLERLHTADAVFQGKRVLVVDDDVRNIFSLTSMLEEHGVEVAFAENGRDALAWLEGHADDGGRAGGLPTDLVLMDVMMPGMDGYETTRAVRANPAWRGLPIIAVTAKAMKGDREKCLEAGASDYITKPVDPEQLLSLLRVWLYR